MKNKHIIEKNLKTINGVSLLGNGNIDLEGLSNLSHPKLGVEVLTEERHPVSGKPIYTKTINFGAWPNNTTKSVNHNILHAEDLSLDEANSFTGSSSGAFHALGNYYANADGVCFVANRTNITIKTSGNYSSYIKSYITLRYTKTTDTSETPVRLVGGGFKFIESDVEPENPSLGDEWHNTTNDIIYKRRKKNGILGWYEI